MAHFQSDSSRQPLSQPLQNFALEMLKKNKTPVHLSGEKKGCRWLALKVILRPQGCWSHQLDHTVMMPWWWNIIGGHGSVWCSTNSSNLSTESLPTEKRLIDGSREDSTGKVGEGLNIILDEKHECIINNLWWCNSITANEISFSYVLHELPRTLTCASLMDYSCYIISRSWKTFWSITKTVLNMYGSVIFI